MDVVFKVENLTSCRSGVGRVAHGAAYDFSSSSANFSQLCASEAQPMAMLT
jgi:hypothetical protein